MTTWRDELTDAVEGETRVGLLDGEDYTVTRIVGTEAVLALSSGETRVRSLLWVRLWTRRVRQQS